MARTILSAEDAAAIIAADYQTYLGRAPDATGLAAWQSALMNGMSEASFIADLAASTEAQSDIAGLYQTMLGRSGSSDEVAGWQTTLAATSLQTVRTDFANSAEAQSDIAGLYQTMLGRSGSSAEVAGWQTTLAATSLQTVRTGFAESQEAQADITAMYQNILGRTPAASEVAGWQTTLANSSLQSVQSAIAHSTEANADIAGLYVQILGRTASASEAAGWENTLSGSSLQAIRADIAASSESQADLTALYREVFSTTPDGGTLAGLESQLANGTSKLSLLLDLEFQEQQLHPVGGYVGGYGAYDGVTDTATSTITITYPPVGTSVSDTAPTPSNPTDTITIQLTPDTLGLSPSFVVKLDGQLLGQVSVGAATTSGSPISASFSGDWGLGAHVLELDYTGSQPAAAPDTVQVQAVSFMDSVAGTTTTYGYNDTATLNPTNSSIQFAIGTQSGASYAGTTSTTPLDAGSVTATSTISPLTAVTLTDASSPTSTIIAGGSIVTDSNTAISSPLELIAHS